EDGIRDKLVTGVQTCALPISAETLPEGFSFEWTTLAFQQIRAGNTAAFAFGLGVVFVYLVLAAQFESLTLPLAVILIVPMCLVRSEERRVGKEWRLGWAAGQG